MIIFCLGVLFIAISTEAFTVLGPAVPLVVQAGRSVTLPCSADTPLPTLDLEVQWMRVDSGSIVHMFQKGGSRSESQRPSYRGRAEFFSEEISKGNFSLLLMNVTSKDKGLYKCVVLSDQESRETTVRIDVERLTVTGAVEPVFAYVGEDVILNCTVDTHVPVIDLQVQWIKIDGEILVLLFDEGESRPESQDERFRGRAEFFREEIPKGNFSMKLRDIKTEDRGEFMCRVDTDSESVHASAWLQEQGLSTLSLCVLGLTLAAAVFAVLSCIPAVCRMTREKEDKDPKAAQQALRRMCGINGKWNGIGWLCFLQVSVPCILLSIAFVIWGIIESSVGEAYVCSVVNLVRILVVFKVAPYELPGKYFEKFTERALHFEIFFLTTGINSVLLQNSGAAVETKVLIGIFFGLVLLYGLLGVRRSNLYSAYFFGARSQNIMDFEIFFLIFTRSSFGFGAVFMVWFILPALDSALHSLRIEFFSQQYLWQKLFEVLQFILESAIYLLLLHFISDQDKEHPGIMCFTAFLYIMKAIMRFNHRSDLPAVPHILAYVFGSAGLSVLNSVALATEVFLKAEKGQRTVEDLRVVILLIESLFLACWLCLQTYAFCIYVGLIKQLKDLFQCCKKQEQRQTSDQHNQPSNEVQQYPGEEQWPSNEVQQYPGEEQWFSLEEEEEIKKIVEKAFPGMLAKLLTPAVAVESVSPPTQRTTQNQEAPDGAEEMDPLSLPERTTEHRQEMPQDATEMEPLCSSTKSEVIAPPISQFK